MFYFNTVSPFTLELLKNLTAIEELKQFNLVGGTALSLQIGHRISLDLDFFTQEIFDVDRIEEIIFEKYPESITKAKVSNVSLIMDVNNVKVDFIRYKYPLVDEIVYFEHIKMYSKRDIAAMKLSEIAQRAEKKDFYDLYYLLNDFTLSEMLSFFHKKYKQTELMHIIKSITFFDDAETSFDIISFKKVSWEEVKEKIKIEAQKIE